MIKEDEQGRTCSQIGSQQDNTQGGINSSLEESKQIETPSKKLVKATGKILLNSVIFFSSLFKSIL